MFDHKTKRSELKLKQHRWYLMHRVYLFLAVIVSSTIGLWGFPRPSTPKYMFNQLNEALSFLLIFLVMLPVPFMLGNLVMFPFEFSIFGPYERTPFPKEKPILKQSWSWGGVSWFYITLPIIIWRVYASGIGISILGVSKVFIPVGNIVQLQSNFIRGYKLWHSSPDLRNPVTLPNETVFKAVQDIMSRDGKDEIRRFSKVNLTKEY